VTDEHAKGLLPGGQQVVLNDYSANIISQGAASIKLSEILQINPINT
jgi:hypothetical protein